MTGRVISLPAKEKHNWPFSSPVLSEGKRRRCVFTSSSSDGGTKWAWVSMITFCPLRKSAGIQRPLSREEYVSQ